MSTSSLQLARRLGAARLALASVEGTPRHASVSNIQKAAVIELLQDATASRSLSGEEVAHISDLIMQATWACGHADELLQILALGAVPKRRKQQEFFAATTYLNHARWNRFTNPNCDLNSKADFFANFAACNLDCINPTEPTYKHWTSQILVAHFDKDTCRSLDRGSKYALMDHLKKEHKKNVKNRQWAPAIYMLKLPSDPQELRNLHPQMFQGLFAPGEEPSGSRLDETLVMAMDASFQCRGGIASSSAIAKAMPAAGMTAHADSLSVNLLPQIIQGLASFLQNSGTLPGTIPGFRHTPPHGGGRRSWRALEEEPPGMASAAGPLQMAPPLSADATAGAQPQAHGAGAQPQAHAAGAQPKAAPLPIYMPRDGPTDEAVAPTGEAESEGSAKSPGDILLDAILARDAASKLAASEKKRAAKDMLRAETAEQANQETAKKPKLAEQARPTAPETAKKPKLAGKGASEHATPTAKKAKLAGKGASEHESAKPTKASMSHERSRSQFLCRTGVKGEASEKFRYRMSNGDVGEYATEKAAKAAANRWLQNRK
jgi:hypothetical protein